MTDATADAAGDETEAVKKSSKLPMIIGLVLALLGGGGGFFAAWSGMLPIGGGGAEPATEDAHGAPAADGHGVVANAPVSFIEMPSMVISLGPSSARHHLRFQANLEVEPAHAAEVEALKPRVVDVLNTYLQALETRDLEAQGALIRIRSQMLRRIQLVVGEGRVRDLLVMEFVLN